MFYLSPSWCEVSRKVTDRHIIYPSRGIAVEHASTNYVYPTTFKLEYQLYYIQYIAIISQITYRLKKHHILPVTFTRNIIIGTRVDDVPRIA